MQMTIMERNIPCVIATSTSSHEYRAMRLERFNQFTCFFNEGEPTLPLNAARRTLP